MADAATEHTLRRCLEELEDIRKILRGQRGSGKSTKEIEQELRRAERGFSMGLQSNTRSLGGNNRALKLFGNAVTDAIGDLAGFTAGLIKAPFKIAAALGNASQVSVAALTELSSSGLETSEMFSHMRRLFPSSFAPFFDLASDLAKQVEEKFSFFTTVSKSGIHFGESIGRLNERAAYLGTSLSNMQQHLEKNAADLSAFGSTTKAANTALQIHTAGFARNRQEMLRYGMEYDEQFERFMSFFSQNALVFRYQKTSQEQIINLSKDYAIELRKLADLTGQDVNAMEESIKQINLDKSFTSLMAGMGDTQKNTMDVLMASVSQFGPGMTEFIKSIASGIAPVTEAGSLFAATSGKMGVQIEQLVNRILAGEGLNELQLSETLAAIGASNEDYIRSQSKLGTVLMQTGDPLGQVFSDMHYFVQQAAGGFKDLHKAKVDETGGAMMRLKETMLNVRQAFSPLIEELADGLVEWMTKFTPSVKEFVEYFEGSNWRELLDQVTTDLSELLIKFNPLEESGRTEIVNAWYDLMQYFKEVLNSIPGVEMLLKDKTIAREKDIDNLYSKYASGSNVNKFDFQKFAKEGTTGNEEIDKSIGKIFNKMSPSEQASYVDIEKLRDALGDVTRKIVNRTGLEWLDTESNIQYLKKRQKELQSRLTNILKLKAFGTEPELKENSSSMIDTKSFLQPDTDLISSTDKLAYTRLALFGDSSKIMTDVLREALDAHVYRHDKPEVASAIG